MFDVVNNAIRRTVSSLLWLATGMDGERIWQNSRPLEAAKSVFVMLFGSSDSAIDNGLSSCPPSLITILSRPTFARASTSATLVHVDIDFVSPDSLQKPSTHGLKSADLVDCFRNHLLSKSVAPVEDSNLDQGAPIVNVIAPSSVVQRRCVKRASKNMSRWAPDPLERGIRVNRPVTGVERLARLQRLSPAV